MIARLNARREDGQALVLSVLFLAALLGCCALVLDVGSWFREKRQLQANADAAALAGAQSLPSDPGGASALAVDYATKNGGGVSLADVTVSNGLSVNDTIAVKAHNDSPGFFSKLFGINTVNVGATATARTDLPAQVQYAAPMVVNWQHPDLGGTSGCPCYGQETTLPFDPMGSPGAFGMIDLNGEGGTVGSSDEANWILHGFDALLGLGSYPSDPGAKFSSGNIQSALEDRIGTVLLFPVFRTLSGGGSNAQYDIIGWVGFYLDGYDVKGNNATLTGHFTTYIAKGIQITSGSGSSQPDYGVRTIQLIH
jgi:Flp pilus assembly protein TadG